MSNRPTKKPLASQRVREARRAGGGSKKTIWIFVGVALVLAVALAVAVTVTSKDSDPAGGGTSPSGGTVVPSGDLAHGEVTVTGTPLPAGQGATDPAVGQQIPTVTGEAFDGSPLSISADGRPKVVMFLAHWCPHCQAEVPRLQEWLDASAMPTDVDLVAVATATDRTQPNYPPGPWLRREAWSVPTMVDDEANTALGAFGASGYPYFVAIDADGEVVARTSGEISTQTWESLLDAARRG